MSRCFPYPPPGYTLSSARNEALIESIKKEKQREKEKRREKKERKKEQKEKRKERKEKRERKDRRKEKKDKTNLTSDKSDIVKDHISQKTHSDPKVESSFRKRRETENEQLEQSSLTEEHGLPDCLPAPSSSYDSTENSDKRKRHSSSIDGSQGHGKAILIRLPSKRENEFHSFSNGQQPNSIYRQTGCSAQHKDDTGPRDRIERDFNLRNEGKEICSISGITGVRLMPNAVLNPMQVMELQYKDLLEKSFPPGLEDASLYLVDSGWLSGSRRNEDERAQKRQRSGSDGSTACSRSSGMWPRAEYLPETDAYALPYVVPY